MQNISISVLLPCYNHAAYIEEAVESIWKQDRNDIEIIAIDDGSSDNTFGKLQDLQKRSPVPMTIESQKNHGVTKTLNKALKKATGKYITLLASDDIYFPNVFTPLIEIFENNEKIKAVYANARVLLKDQLAHRVHTEYTMSLLEKNPNEVEQIIKMSVPSPLLTQCAMYDRKMLLEIGGWDEEVRIDDWPLNIKIFEYLSKHSFEHYFLNLDMTIYRQHDSNISKNPVKMYHMILEVISKYTPKEKQQVFFDEVSRNFGKMMLEYGHYKLGLQTLFKSLRSKSAWRKSLGLIDITRLFIKYLVKKKI